MRSRYSKFKIGDLVKIKAEYGPSMCYGIIMQMGEDANWDLDERFVRVLWTGRPRVHIRDERIRHLILAAES
jgi:hypothetical protein